MFWRILVILLTSLTMGIVGYFWITPFFTLNIILVTSLCALGGFVLGLIINKLSSWIWHSFQSRAPSLRPENDYQRKYLNEKNWIERALRNSNVLYDVSNRLIISLQDTFRRASFRGLESLDAWVNQNLSSGDPALISIRNQWIANNDMDRMRLFKRHLERRPQNVACYKLKDIDFKHTMPYIESFLRPPLSKIDFEREMHHLGYNYPTIMNYIMLLAREGKLDHLKFAIRQLDPHDMQKILPEAILAAANNNHLPTVKESINFLDNTKRRIIVKQLFVSAIKKNNESLLRWLLTKYNDDELKNDEMQSLTIENQIKFHSTTPLFFSYNNHNQSLKTYEEVRRKKIHNG